MPCDSAIEYFCTSESCDWNFTHGLNPLNPITEKNEESRPSWIVGDLEWKNNGISPVVFAEWDD